MPDKGFAAGMKLDISRGLVLSLAQASSRVDFFRILGSKQNYNFLKITVKPGQAYPPNSINEFIIRNLSPLAVVHRFQIHLYILTCIMSREFTCDSVTRFLPA